jgi:SAM-dependent methyltransferase
MPRYAPFDWYEQPLYYDIIFDADTPQETRFLDAMRREHGRTRGRTVLEPACGSGRLMASLGRLGYRPIGFDLCPGMIDFSRRRLGAAGITATLFEASMDDFTAPRRADLAHCLVSTFKYLRDDASVLRHFEGVARALKPGGIYVLGLHLTDYAETSRSRERWIAQRDGVHVVCNIQSEPADRRRRTERVRARLIVNDDQGERHLESHWTFRTYSFRQLTALLKNVRGFEHIATYDFTHNPDHPIAFDGEQLDNVLILRRTSGDS